MSLAAILSGSEWVLADNPHVTMTHDGASRMHLRGGNNFNGQAVLSGSTLTVSPHFMSTMMMPFGPGLVAQERVERFIMEASGQGPLTVTASPDGKTLTLTAGSGQTIATFQQQHALPPAEAPQRFVEIAKEPVEVKPDGERILNCKWLTLNEHSVEIPNAEPWFSFSERNIQKYEHHGHSKLRIRVLEGGAKWFNEMQYYSSVE
eukprot:RCo047262